MDWACKGVEGRKTNKIEEKGGELSDRSVDVWGGGGNSGR